MTMLVISGDDIRGLMRPADYLDAVERGFRALAEGEADAPHPMHIAIPRGGLHAKGARLALGRDYVAIKVNANCPTNPVELGLPTIQGGIMLFDGNDGRLLAFIDSIEVTLRRTAAASALAALHLAREDSHTILVCGCGEQGRAHVEALAAIRPVKHVLLWDRDPAAAAALAAATGGSVAADLRASALGSDIIVTCTSATESFLNEKMVAPGAFVAAVGADSPAKSEIAPELMARAKVVTDITGQCANMGDLHHAIAAGAMAEVDVHGELAALVADMVPGRQSPDEVFLFDSTGTGIQDVATAAVVYEKCRDAGAGLAVDLG